MSAQGISCICLTYGRWWYLEEAIDCFLRQEFGAENPDAVPRELIVVNDDPAQELRLADRQNDCGMVRIVNLPARFESLNDKFDYAVGLARFPLICMWDDDDISLRSRLRVSSLLMEQTGADYLAIGWHYAWNAGKPLEIIHRGIHGGDCFRKDCYQRLDGSRGAGHNDQNFVGKVRKDPATKYVVCDDPVAAQYIYRWGGIVAHNSAYSLDLATCMDHFAAEVQGDPRYRRGVIDLEPRQKVNWQRMASDCLMVITKDGKI